MENWQIKHEDVIKDELIKNSKNSLENIGKTIGTEKDNIDRQNKEVSTSLFYLINLYIFTTNS